nr:hypothetical protein [uncultured Halomonas sp.]
MLVGACGRRLGDPVTAFSIGKRRVVKKRDEADNKKIGFIPLVVLFHGIVTALAMVQR